MSFITFDYICKECGEQYPDKMVRRSAMDDQRCEKCGNVLHKMPAGPITTFKFHDRANIKSRKAVSLRDPTHAGAKPKDFAKCI